MRIGTVRTAHRVTTYFLADFWFYTGNLIREQDPADHTRQDHDEDRKNLDVTS